MELWMIILLGVLLVCALGVGIYFFLQSRKSPEQKKLERQLKNITADYKKQQKELAAERKQKISPLEKIFEEQDALYTSKIWDAKNNLQKLTSAQKRDIKKATKEVESALDRGKETIASLGRIKLTPLKLRMPGLTVDLDPSISATVEQVGNIAHGSRVSLSRVATGAIFAGSTGAIVGGLAQKKTTTDTREVYLHVSGASFSQVYSYNVSDGPKLRTLASQITTAARQVDNFKARRREQIVEARKALKAAEEPRPEIDAAREIFDNISSESGDRNTALRELQAAEAGFDSRAAELEAQYTKETEAIHKQLDALKK